MFTRPFGTGLLALIVVLGSATALPAHEAVQPVQNKCQGSDPEIVDQAGDANGTGQALPLLSISGLDIERVWFCTPYATEKELRPDGSIRVVRYVPTALVVTIDTRGLKRPPSPSQQSIVYRFYLSAEIPGCPAAMFSLTIGIGAASGGFNTCSGSMPAYVTMGTGYLDALVFPVDANPWLVRGLRFGWNTAGGVTLKIASHMSAQNPALMSPPIDEGQGAQGYEFASELPPDVDCTATPSHPECTGGGA